MAKIDTLKKKTDAVLLPVSHCHGCAETQYHAIHTHTHTDARCRYGRTILVGVSRGYLSMCVSNCDWAFRFFISFLEHLLDENIGYGTQV